MSLRVRPHLVVDNWIYGESWKNGLLLSLGMEKKSPFGERSTRNREDYHPPDSHIIG